MGAVLISEAHHGVIRVERTAESKFSVFPSLAQWTVAQTMTAPSLRSF